MFFQKFPLSLVRIGSELKTIEDFFLRVAPSIQYNQLANMLTPYFVSGDQRIEDVAFDVYGDPQLHWVILLCNNIVNPYEEWPLSEDVLLKRVFEWYYFTVGVEAGHGLVAGDIVQSTNGYKFSVVSSATESVVLQSLNGVAYLSRDDVLSEEGRNPRLPIRITSVDDPMNTVHHFEDVQTGYWVDFDQNLFGQGLITPVTNLEYEQNRNESKRMIRILDKRYLSDFIQTFDRELQT